MISENWEGMHLNRVPHFTAPLLKIYSSFRNSNVKCLRNFCSHGWFFSYSLEPWSNIWSIFNSLYHWKYLFVVKVAPLWPMRWTKVSVSWRINFFSRRTGLTVWKVDYQYPQQINVMTPLGGSLPLLFLTVVFHDSINVLFSAINTNKNTLIVHHVSYISLIQ